MPSKKCRSAARCCLRVATDRSSFPNPLKYWPTSLGEVRTRSSLRFSAQARNRLMAVRYALRVLGVLVADGAEEKFFRGEDGGRSGTGDDRGPAPKKKLPAGFGRREPGREGA